MEYEDRITVVTPEGVEMELALGGLGSRFLSAFVDLLIEAALVGALAAALFGLLSTAVAAAGLALGVFAVLFGYHVLWEVLGSGRTPGKRVAGLRVVRDGGGPVRFRESAVRNIIRVVDLLPPVTYAVGALAIMLTSRNQRLGDLAAGTLVVRAPRGRLPAPAAPAPVLPGLERWDVSAVTFAELAAVRCFLERRPGLDPAARGRLAGELAGRLRPKVAGPVDGHSDEAFLEGLAAAKLARR